MFVRIKITLLFCLNSTRYFVLNDEFLVVSAIGTPGNKIIITRKWITQKIDVCACVYCQAVCMFQL